MTEASAILDRDAANWKKRNELIVGMAEILSDEGVETIADLFSNAEVANSSHVDWDKLGLTMGNLAQDFLIWADCRSWTLDMGLDEFDSFRLNGYVYGVYDRYKAKKAQRDSGTKP
jgi:hypothetical protein